MSEPEYVKILLPGETPWAEVVYGRPDDPSLKVSISNYVAGNYSPQEWHELIDAVSHRDIAGHKPEPWDGRDKRPHQYKMGDVVLVARTEYGLEPVEHN